MSGGTKRDLSGLQLLRATAAFSVVVHHGIFEIWKSAGLRAPFSIGAFGVDLFFVLSGLVMWISTRGIQPGFASTRHFLTKRFLRVTPLYWTITILLAGSYFAAPGLTHTDQFANGRLWKSLTYAPQASWPILVVGWSLSHEMFFYLLFGIKLVWKRGTIVVLSMLMLFGFVGWLFPREGVGDWNGLVFSPFQLEFLMGIGCGWLFERKSLPPATLSILVIAVLASSGFLLALDRWILWGGIGLAACMAALKREDVLRRAPRFLMALGESSYALYLIHLPVVMIVARFLRGRLDGSFLRWIALASTVILCELLAIAVWKLFDEPVQRRIRDWLKTTRTVANN